MDSFNHSHRRVLSISLVIGFVITNLIVGLIGGTGAFVLLSSSQAKPVKALRTFLHISGQTVSVPVRENVTLQESSQLIDASNKVIPAVVSISTFDNVSTYFGSTTSQQVSGGSGFIITNDGLILTNRHVVDDPSAKYRVILNDGRIFEATVQAKDTLNDLAVLKIQASGLPVVEFGQSSVLQVGQFIFTVGNSLGQFNNSITSGIVSAKNRTITAGTEELTNLIQTDALVTQAASGGPLVNLVGQVVGINTAPTDSATAGYTIPIDNVMGLISTVRQTGQIIRSSLGIHYIPVTTELQQLDQLPVGYGVLVSSGTVPPDLAVVPGGPADTAGIKQGDIILDINNEQVTVASTLPDLLQKYGIGTTVTVNLNRGGKAVSVRATLTQN